jgi:hypothetical protein
LRSKLKDTKKKKEALTKEKDIVFRSNLLISNLVKSKQEKITSKVSGITTKLLKSAGFDLTVKLDIVYKQKNTGMILTYIDGDGNVFGDILYDKGGSICDLVSLGLRISFLLLKGTNKILFLDEPFRFVDEDRIKFISKFLKSLSEELNIQMVIVTRDREIIDIADKVIEI